jgi:hypothetical protein
MIGNLKLASLPANVSNWTASSLQSLGNLSLVLSPMRIQRLNPQVPFNLVFQMSAFLACGVGPYIHSGIYLKIRPRKYLPAPVYVSNDDFYLSRELNALRDCL